MLKGVNKKVVEVVNLDNEYFERAILFVKAEKRDRDELTLKQKAREYVDSIRYHPKSIRGWGRWVWGGMKWAAAAGVGALIMAMIKF